MSTQTTFTRRTDRQHEMRGSAGVMVVVIGLGVGALTSIGQKYLGGAARPLVNSASAWLVAPFAVGALMRTRRDAATAGVSTCVLQLVGYVITARLRGFSSSESQVLFWGICALAGGPLFGIAGHVAHHEQASIRGLGPAILASAFISEGLWTYLHELRYYSSAALWIGLGLGIAVGRLRGIHGYRWLALTMPLALLSEIILTQVYR